jgi:hypothetical protein
LSPFVDFFEVFSADFSLVPKTDFSLPHPAARTAANPRIGNFFIMNFLFWLQDKET